MVWISRTRDRSEAPQGTTQWLSYFENTLSLSLADKFSRPYVEKTPRYLCAQTTLTDYIFHLLTIIFHILFLSKVFTFISRAKKTYSKKRKRDERDQADYKHPRIGTRLPVELSALAEE